MAVETPFSLSFNPGAGLGDVMKEGRQPQDRLGSNMVNSLNDMLKDGIAVVLVLPLKVSFKEFREELLQKACPDHYVEGPGRSWGHQDFH